MKRQIKQSTISLKNDYKYNKKSNYTSYFIVGSIIIFIIILIIFFSSTPSITKLKPNLNAIPPRVNIKILAEYPHDNKGNDIKYINYINN